jgi:RNA polymerase sigma-70 factor, ECF subfamily
MGAPVQGAEPLTELVVAARGGDKEAFGEIVRRTFADTYTLALRLTGNEQDANDVAQETYIRAWRAIGRFRGDAQVSTWLYRITANTAATHTKRRRRLRTEPLELVAEPADERRESHPALMAESFEAADRLGQAVRDLPANLRSVVVLKDVYGMSHEDVAAELGISVANAKVRLHRGRRRLRDALFTDEEQARAV